MAKAAPEAEVKAPEAEVKPEAPAAEAPVEAVLPFEVPKGAQVEDLGGGTWMVKA